MPTGAARSLAVRHHEAQALVLPELSGPYFSELLMGFEARAAELGHGVLLLQAAGRDDLRSALRRLASRVDGDGRPRVGRDPRGGRRERPRQPSRW